MTDRVLLIKGPKGIQKYNLLKDKITLGRDKKCDVFLDDESISRKHALILNKFGNLYIENISTTGEMIVDGRVSEISDFPKGIQVQFGPFTLEWTDSQQKNATPARDQVLSSGPDSDTPPSLGDSPVDSLAGPGSPAIDAHPSADEALNPAQDLNLGVVDDFVPEIVDASPNQQNYGDSEPIAEYQDPEQNLVEEAESNSTPELDPINSSDENNDADNTAVSALADLQFNNEQIPNVEDEPSLGIEQSQASNASGSAATQVIDQVGAVAVLKIIKGEEIGRQIPLEGGAEWTVGRGSQNEVQIKSSKISRQHFKIVRIGKAYRLQDLGSANGTYVNGASVSDSPISSYDTIKAGQVEFQFLIGEEKVEESGTTVSKTLGHPPDPPTSPAPANLGTLALGLGSATQMASPASEAATLGSPQFPGFQSTSLVRTQNTVGLSKLNLTSAGNRPFTHGHFSSTSAADSRTKSQKATNGVSLVQKFRDQPTPRKILILLFFVLIVGGLLQNPDELTTQNIPVAQTNSAPDLQNSSMPPTVELPAPSENRSPASSSPSPTSASNIDTREISADFLNLSPAEQQEIQNLYAKAEKAAAAKNWNQAFEASGQILKKVKFYKRAGDILLEAQNTLNDDQLGNIAAAPSGLEDAAAENQDRVALLIDSGNKALSETRWEDATEAFSKALNLDPTNKSATQGLAKALAKDASASVTIPESADQNLMITDDSTAQASRELKDELMGLQTRFQDARNRINRGTFGGALGILREVDEDLGSKITALNESPGARAPASLENEVISEMKLLQNRVREATETARNQLLSEYQTQIADAEEFNRNRQYAQAREIYDRILRNEPFFEDVRIARDNLYTRIIIEAKNIYQEALIYQSLDSMENAIEGYKKARELLADLPDPVAMEYFRRATDRLRRLER